MAIQWTGLFANTGYSSANNKTQDDAVTGMQDTLYVTGPGYGAYEAVVKLYNSTGAVVATVNVSGGGGAFSAPPPVRFVDNGTVYSYSLEVVRGFIPTEDADGIMIRLVGGASKRYPSPMAVTPSGDVEVAGAVLGPSQVHKNQSLKSKIADVVGGVGSALMILEGDSHFVSYGAGSGGGSYSYNLNNSRPYSYPSLIGKYLAAKGIPVSLDSWVGTQGLDVLLSAANPKMVFTGTWAPRQFGCVCGGTWGCSTVGGTAVYTPELPWDSCDVYYPRESGFSGVADVSATGATTQTLNCTNASSVYAKVTLTKASPSLGAVTITVTTAFDPSFGGVSMMRFYNSQSPRLEILNMGTGGATWAGIINANGKPYRQKEVRQLLAPAIVVINNFHNDLSNGTSLATYLAGFDTYFATVPTAGKFVVCGFPAQVSNRPNFANRQAWVDAVAAKMSGLGINFRDEATIVGYTWEAALANGYINGGNDPDHGSKRSYGVRAQAVANDLFAMFNSW